MKTFSSNASCRPVNILVGVSGSVATIKLRLLVTQLAALNAHIKIVATDAATRFFDPSWDSWEGKPEIYGIIYPKTSSSFL